MFLSGDILIDILGILIALLTLVVAYMKWSFTYWEKKGYSTIPAQIPFGNFADLFMQRISFGENVTQHYNMFKKSDAKFFGSFFFARPILNIADPELIKNMMTKDFDHFVDRGIYVNERDDPIAAHLFSLPGTKWRNLRVKLTPTFTSGKMKMMFQTLVDCSNGLVKVVEDCADTSVDIKDIVGRYTTDVIGSCAFGLDCNSLNDPNTEFRYYGKKIFSPSIPDAIKGFFAFSAPSVLKFFHARVLAKDVSDFFYKIVKQTINYRESNNIKRKDFMNLLLQLKNKGKLDEDDNDHPHNNHNRSENGTKSLEPETTLSVEQIAAQSFLFFAAGFETSSTTLTFCLYELVKNVECQEKLRQEIVRVLEKHDGNITYDAMMEMKYMDNVINETLRKYPPVPVLNRICTKEYKVPEINLHVSEGQGVFIPIEGIQNDERHYPEPHKFDPDRFTEENKKTRHPFTFLPFGEGPRVCIGLRFGMMQTKVALTVLLKNFKFTLSNKTVEPFVMDPKSFVMSVRDGVWLNASKI